MVTSAQHKALCELHNSFRREMKKKTRPNPFRTPRRTAVEKQNAFVLWFDELGIEDVPLVGGKNASLGEMYRNLVPKGVPIPNRVAITANA